MRRNLAFLILILSLTWVLPQGASAAEMKIAFMNVEKVFNEYKKTADNDSALKEEGKEKEEARQKLIDDIRKMKDELELLSDDAKKEKEAAMNEKVRQLQDYEFAARREHGERLQNMGKEIFNDIEEVVQAYGKKHGMDIIFNDQALLYKKDAHDITEEVLAELNKKYKK